jgi:small subunit ribosomal protein S10e
MMIPKKNIIEVYSYLFKEGVLICHQDKSLPRHPNIPHAVPNLHVLKLMQGFVTKGYVKEQYAWRHHYWFLTNEGIEYLREYLNLPSTIVPATVKAQTTTQKLPGEREERGDREGGFRGGRGGRGGSRGGRGGRGGFRGESREGEEERRPSSRGRGFSKDKVVESK